VADTSATVDDLGSILGIWGHPDDEAWLTSGVMMRAIESGHRVVCVTATRGEAGFPADDPRSESERMAVRQAELAACLELLGVKEHRYLGYGDGRCADVPDDEAVATLTDIIADVRPDTVITFGPDGGTGHPDHIAACRWTTRVVEAIGHDHIRLLYATRTTTWRERFLADVDPASVMMIEDLEPEAVDESELAVSFRCDDELVARKVAAMRAQTSQIEPMVTAVGLDAFTALVRDEFFREPRPSDRQFIDRMSTVRLAAPPEFA
jgi:LmbE family N-acetylglucosaminyl deacetylase